MIPFDEIDMRLKSLGKDRVWLAKASGRKPDSIRVALAPNAVPAKRSELLQKALSDAIEREEASRGPAQAQVSGIYEIRQTKEQAERADLASRAVNAPSLADFCLKAIMLRANEILNHQTDPCGEAIFGALKPVVPLPTPATTAFPPTYWIDLCGGIAAGAPISSDAPREPLSVMDDYGPDAYALRVFGRSMEPRVFDDSIIIVRRLPEGSAPKTGSIVVYSDAYGLALKQLAYRKAKPGEESNAFGKVAVLKSINPAFPEIQTLDGGILEAVFVEVLPAIPSPP